MAERFKLDENLPKDAERYLRNANFDVETVFNEGLGGDPDERVFRACQEEKRTLVTLDLDFSDIRQYPPRSHAGIWILRPPSQSINDVLVLLRGALETAKTEPVTGRLWIVESGRVRIRE